MKITEQITLAGQLFDIDKDAFLRLKNFLNHLDMNLSGTEEKEAIMKVIEKTICDLFIERITKQKLCININDVNEVITLIESKNGFSFQNTTTMETAVNKSDYNNKRLYRIKENSVFGGVCGGLGIYFNIDPILIRLIFVLSVLLFGSGTLVYIVLWIIIPKAKTAAQRLEMLGITPTLADYSRSA
jgi:phage shock protein PspC (stress-responsive transcriptional regulator)